MAGCHGATTWISWPRAARLFAIGSMKLPTPSPGKRGYDVVTKTTMWRMGSGARGPAQPAAMQHETPRCQQRLGENFGGHFGIAFFPFDEDDRDLADGAPASLG